MSPQGPPLYLLRHAWAPFATDGIGPEKSLLIRRALRRTSSYRPYNGVSRTTKERAQPCTANDAATDLDRWCSRMALIGVNVDGIQREVEVDPRLLLVHWLRDKIGLVGTP